MTERTVTLCDAERAPRHGWWTAAADLPGSWETVTVPTTDGSTRTAHLCPKHRGARVEGETGGTHPRITSS